MAPVAPEMEFMAPVPLEMCTALGKFWERQWHMMALLARCPGALDLVHSTPALTFALASNWVFAQNMVKQPLRAARSLLRKRQVDICDWLAFPARPSTIKILRKLTPGAISIEPLLYLRDGLWNEDALRLFQHCPTISQRIIFLVTHPVCRKHFSLRFLIEVAAVEARDDFQWPELIDLHYSAHNADLFRDCPNRVFDSIGAFNEHLDTLHLRDRPSRWVCLPEMVLPRPPLPGTDTIIPLLTGRDLLNEGTAMHNCVASLYRSVINGTSAFYRMTAPERATLSLEREDGVWRLGQLAGPKNSSVSQQAYAAVYSWLGSFLDDPDYAIQKVIVDEAQGTLHIT